MRASDVDKATRVTASPLAAVQSLGQTELEKSAYSGIHAWGSPGSNGVKITVDAASHRGPRGAETRLRVDLPLAPTRTNTGLELPLAVPGLRVEAPLPHLLPELRVRRF